MKTSTIILALLLSACNSKESKAINKLQKDNDPQTETCTCEKINNDETVVYATNIHVKKDSPNNTLEFRCASVLEGTASVSDINGNDERCAAMYSIECVSSVNKELELSPDFKYFTDQLQLQDMFFEDLKNKDDDYFEFRLSPDKKIISISRINMN